MVSAIEQLNGINILSHESFAVVLLAALIKFAVYGPSLTVIETLAEEDLKWEMIAE